ncbi:MAG: hypothetical protein ABIY55_16175 [Kofleriaceae bacterium]
MLVERLPIDHVEQSQGANRALDTGIGLERDSVFAGWSSRAVLRGGVNRDVQLVEKPQQVFEHAGPQHRRKRPQLGDRQRRDHLVRIDKVAQHHGVELELRPSDQRAGNQSDPHAPRRRPRRELR